MLGYVGKAQFTIHAEAEPKQVGGIMRQPQILDHIYLCYGFQQRRPHGQTSKAASDPTHISHIPGYQRLLLLFET